MDPKTDLFTQLEVEQPKLRNFILIFLLYSIPILITLISFYSRPNLHSFRFLVDNPKYLLFTAITQVLPVAAAFLFILKTKGGWILMVLISAIMASVFIKFLLVHFFYPGRKMDDFILVREIYFSVNFVAVLILSFTKPVIKLFKLNRLLIALTIFTSSALFTLTFIYTN